MSIFFFPEVVVAPPTNSTSPILLGDIFWSTLNDPSPGKLYAGQTYNWSDNPKLKSFYDTEDHAFIIDNGSTFDILDYDGFLRASQSNPGSFVQDIVSTASSVNNEVRGAYFGIYGDAAVVAVDTTLSSQGTYSLPATDEWLSSQEIRDVVTSVNTDITSIENDLRDYPKFTLFDALDGQNPQYSINQNVFEQDVVYLFRNTRNTDVFLDGITWAPGVNYDYIVEGFDFATNTIVPNSRAIIPAGSEATIYVSSGEGKTYLKKNITAAPITSLSLPRIVGNREFGWTTGGNGQWTPFPITPSQITTIDTNVFNFSTTVSGRFTVLEDGDYYIGINYTTDPIGTNAKYIFALRENDTSGNEIIYFTRGFTGITSGNQNWGTSGSCIVPLIANQTVQVASFTEFNPTGGRFASLSIMKVG